MKYEIKFTTQFMKDLKRAKKQHKDRVFTGIFNRLLTEPLDSLKKMFENQKKQPRKW